MGVFHPERQLFRRRHRHTRMALPLTARHRRSRTVCLPAACALTGPARLTMRTASRRTLGHHSALSWPTIGPAPARPLCTATATISRNFAVPPHAGCCGPPRPSAPVFPLPGLTAPCPGHAAALACPCGSAGQIACPARQCGKRPASHNSGDRNNLLRHAQTAHLYASNNRSRPVRPVALSFN